ncbi:HD domain-containing protein [Candidatus Woesearchaeota archaeon]|nr:HD domain-containing protein [Candidatus Woesearchaeota archaeon]
MNKETIQNWARELVEANPDNFHSPEDYIRHLGEVYDVAEVVVGNILAKYPNIPLIAEEISLAAGLHDIGRPLEKDQTFHELRGARLIEENGLTKGVAPSLREVDRIAQMIRPHGFVYEMWHDPDCADQRSEYEPLDDILLLPRTWQEAIVAYADMANLGGERVRVAERMDELIHRYEHDPKYKNEMIVRTAQTALDRLLSLAERVELLEQGKMNDKEIVQYGFL